MNTGFSHGAAADALTFEALAACSRARLDESGLSRIRALERENVDWSRVAALAAMHGTRPMVYRALSIALPQSVPAAALDRLREDCLASAAHNLSLTSELLDLLQRLEEAGVPAIPMKGPVLAEAAYGSIALREFQDLDILVRKKHIPRAIEVLVATGYSEVDTSKDGDAYSHVFACPATATLVDLHWDFAGPRFFFGLEPERLFDRCVSTRLSGRTIRSLPTEDTLLLLCMHGAKHCWSRLAWIGDIAELVHTRGERIDWADLIGMAEASGSERMLLLGLSLAADLLGARLPADVYAIASQPAVAELADTVRTWLLSGKDGATDPIEREAFYVAMRERPADRAKHFIHGCGRFLVPNARDERAVRLPRGLAWLRWLVRPVRLVLTYGNPAALLKRLVGIA